jgi:Mce-associated membrane protein
MTGTLEAPIHPEEDVSAEELADKSSGPKTSRSKSTVKAKSTEGSKSSEKRGKAKKNGSALAAQEVKEHSVNDAAATAERPVEPRVIQSADHEELQPSPPAAGSQQQTTRRRASSWVAVRMWVRSNLLLSGLAVALVVAVVFLTLTQLSLNSENSLNSARTSAVASAKSYAVDLASYNYKNLNQDFGKVLAESTPTFKQNFTQSSEALKTAIVRYDASAWANVVGAGLVSATTSRAVVLVFLNQTVQNTLQKNKPTTESRVEITLVRSGGRWLIDQVTLL